MSRLLLPGLAALLLVLAFVGLASEVLEEDIPGADIRLVTMADDLRARHPWLVEAMRDLSGLGGAGPLVAVVSMAVGYLLLIKARSLAAFVATSALSGIVAVDLLKGLFGRTRPALVSAAVAASGMSFPSGHATMSATIFLTVGALLASSQDRWRGRIYILGCAVMLSVLVGISRVILGVHWATDVLAGWAFGSAWAATWLALAYWWDNRGN